MIFSTMLNKPSFITHYYPAQDKPFQNLSHLSATDCDDIIQKLAERRIENPKFQRIFGPKYMALRKMTEQEMLKLFRKSGGKPEVKVPHYFVLGESEWFAGLYPETKQIRIELDELPSEASSVTYPDSISAMRFGEQFGLPPQQLKPYHKKVFGLDDIDKLIELYGLPGAPESKANEGQVYENYHRKEFEKYIEVQIWSDEPIRKYLS